MLHYITQDTQFHGYKPPSCILVDISEITKQMNYVQVSLCNTVSSCSGSKSFDLVSCDLDWEEGSCLSMHLV